MMRCSQPLTGPNNKRCKEDEKLLNAVLGIGRKGYIIDTRSLAAAKSSQAKGTVIEVCVTIRIGGWKVSVGFGIFASNCKSVSCWVASDINRLLYQWGENKQKLRTKLEFMGSSFSKLLFVEITSWRQMSKLNLKFI